MGMLSSANRTVQKAGMGSLGQQRFVTIALIRSVLTEENRQIKVRERFELLSSGDGSLTSSGRFYADFSN